MILHVDLDAFFASVEQLDDPTLRGRPVVVGGTGPRGVVAAASYEARRFGVHSAMPTTRARRLCPEAVFLGPRHERYREVSGAVFAMLRSFTPFVEPVSLDEAFVDASRLGPGREVATSIRERIHDETGLTASIGVATTKLVAKLASEEAKPDGLVVVEPGTERDFLRPLPVRRLWGVGPATEAKLEGMGVRTVGELARVPVDSLVAALGPAAGRRLHALAWNRDERPVTPEHEAKSISAEETFARDISDREALRREVRRLADRVSSRLRRSRLAARTVTLKVRFPDFRTITRSSTSRDPSDVSSAIAARALELLDRVETAEGVRLIGVGTSNLECPPNRQEPLFGDRQAAIDAAADAVRRRFGDDALRRG